jgi:hypothetical protein
VITEAENAKPSTDAVSDAVLDIGNCPGKRGRVFVLKLEPLGELNVHAPARGPEGAPAPVWAAMRGGEGKSDRAGSLEVEMTAPTPDEIDDVIADMLSYVPGDNNFDDLWEALAYDPQGELQGIGYGYTPAEARAVAWIVACGWPDECHLLTVPRIVPDGWYFWPPDELLH